VANIRSNCIVFLLFFECSANVYIFIFSGSVVGGPHLSALSSPAVVVWNLIAASQNSTAATWNPTSQRWVPGLWWEEEEVAIVVCGKHTMWDYKWVCRHPNNWAKVALEMQQNSLWATKRNAQIDFCIARCDTGPQRLSLGSQKRCVTYQSCPRRCSALWWLPWPLFLFHHSTRMVHCQV
jgi:hypothetical protein